MPEETRPQFVVTLQGEDIPLRFEVRDWIAAERKLGVAFYPWGRSAWWQRLDGALGLSSLADLIMVGIGHCRPDVTLGQVMDGLADPTAIDAINEQIGAACSGFFIKVGLIKPDPATPPLTAEETGSPSGPTADTTLASPDPSS